MPVPAGQRRCLGLSGGRRSRRTAGGACRSPWHTSRVLCETSSRGCAHRLAAPAPFLFACVSWSLKDPPALAILWRLGIIGRPMKPAWTTDFRPSKSCPDRGAKSLPLMPGFMPLPTTHNCNSLRRKGQRRHVPVAQLDRASASGAEGFVFESRRGYS